MNNLEMAATVETLLKFAPAMAGGKVCRLAIELSADVDKHMVFLIGMLPLILADADTRGRRVIWLAPDGNSEARAQLKTLEYRIFDPMTFGSWANLEPGPANHYQSTKLDEFWVIGDLDWSGSPVGDPRQVVNAVRRVLRTDSCPAVLIHQQGKTPVIPFPLKFGSSCFIATAACAENSPEVERLRQFRDTVLRSSAVGRRTISFYERVSPVLAEPIRVREWLRVIVRVAVIKPLSAAAGWALSHLFGRGNRKIAG